MYTNTLADFTVGQRVQISPSCDLWMRGARYGTVRGIGRRGVRVRVDAIDRDVVFIPELLADAS